MVTPFGPPDPDDPYAAVPDSVLHDVLAETADALGAEYARIARRAGPEEGEAAWRRVRELADERREAVLGGRDRVADRIGAWRREADALRGR
ncbi:hypothetical protein ACIRPH_17330 [Nocardiopsis sp. NPDC101807]|uniref:hypothetical protein n=1 Tax=Nocardiopsis sp. NPDC101807 TaxID=3364339 RepID=UPI0038248796